ncbi:MAG: hypothetical protein ACRDP4_06295 [Nocardioidaceae bacterium]
MTDIDADRLAEIRETYACDPELAEYAPFDQAKHLGPKPWHTQDPALVAWEEAHGHDTRLKCYVEYGCRVIEEEAARDVAFLLDALDAANATLYTMRMVSVALDDIAMRNDGSGDPVTDAKVSMAREAAWSIRQVLDGDDTEGEQ